MMAFKFGKYFLSPNVVFYKSSLSFAFVNRKPVVPGHILVTSYRIVSRFHELSSEEVSDLFNCVHCIAPLLQQQYNATSLTIAIQDGKDAGQTVEHVHVHVLPRKPGDFQRNDEIYEKLEAHDKVEDKFRTEEEMAKEASLLEKLFINKTE